MHIVGNFCGVIFFVAFMVLKKEYETMRIFAHPL